MVRLIAGFVLGWLILGIALGSLFGHIAKVGK